MKVVINNCYGGFELSEKARKRIFEIGCEHTKKITDIEYFGDPEKTEGEKIKSCKFTETPRKDGMVIVDEHECTDEDPKRRSCPVLIKVIEEMKKEANGNCARLEIIEIPDEVDFIIQEYDGLEWIAEKHRIWRCD